MNNRELNLKMAAEVCGLPMVPMGELSSLRPRINVYTTGYLELQPTAGIRQMWAPSLHWQQVFDYVLPALERAGFRWRVCGQPDGKSEVEIYIPDGAFAGWPLIERKALCRQFCEAAWEAWQQLEKS